MSVQISKDVEVKCPNGHTVIVEPDSWEHDEDVEETSDNRMGPSTHHRFTADGIECPRCGEEFDAEIEVDEYPQGSVEETSKSPNVVSNVGDVISCC